MFWELSLAEVYDLIESPLFLDMGYEPFLFWELSLAEVYDLIESYRRKQFCFGN